MNNMKITPIALMLINAIGLSSVHADTSVVNCNTTDHDSDLFCGNNINTNGAVNSVAIGNSVLIPKISVPGKTGIEQAVAIGSNVQATGDNSLVIGNEAITGKSGSIAIGGDDAAGTYNANGKGYILRAFGSNFFDNNITDYRANAAIGNGAVSLGSNSQALADGAVSIGAAATAGAGTQRGNEWDSSSGKQSIALGAESSALNDNTIALGYRTTSTGNSSTAIGNSTVATANNALALGSHSHADADGAVIIGSDAKNTRDTLTAVGLPADNGVNAIGIGSSVRSAANGIAIGRGAEAKISEATTIAIGNGAVSAGGIALGQDSAVVKGNNPSGTASASVSIGRQTTVADYGVALGSRASVGMTLTADGIPERLTSGGLYGTAVGINSGVYSNSALAVGHNAKVSENADAALAVGYNSLSSAQNAIAIGNTTKASAENAISIGSENSLTTGSVAIGVGARAGREDILSLKSSDQPERTWIGKQNNIALGAGAVADGGRVISIGENAGSGTPDNWNIHNVNIGTNAGSQAKRDYSVALGYEAGMVPVGSQDGTEDSQRSPSINIGKQAGKNTVSYGNISVGDNAGTDIADSRSVSNTMIGNGAGAGLASNDGKNAIFPGFGPGGNTLIGTDSGRQLSGDSNVALGSIAGDRATGDNNIYVGHLAGQQSTSDRSVIIGSQAGLGTNNDRGVLIGNFANGGVTTATRNVVGLGSSVKATGFESIAVGFNANSSANNATSIGRFASASGISAVALSTGAQANGENSVAIGNGTKATATNTISIGTGNTVSGDNSGAIGDPSTVSGMNSYSLGNNNTVSANNAFVLGNSVNNAVDSSVVLGDGSTVMAAVATPEYTVNGTTHKFAGSLPVSTVSIGDSGKERTLTNVAAGRVSAASTDAINGSQLFAVASEVEKGNQFAGNTGAFNRRLGEITTISGGLVADATASNKNIRTVAKDGQIDIQMADNLDVASVKAGTTLLNDDGLHITGGPSVTSGGINGGNKIISNVSDGVTDTDAVNKRQLDNISSVVGQGLTFAANEGSDITRKPGDTLVLKGNASTKGDYSGKNIKTVTDISSGMISIQIAESPMFGSVVINNNNSGKITGVNDGAISAESKDAVNGGQIHRVTTSISNIIGGNTHSGADGSLVTSNIGNTGKNTIHDAIDSVRSTAETASSGWNLSVNGQQSSAVKPKETVDLNNKDGNISIAKKDNQVSFNLSDSVKVKENIGIENGPSLTRNGIDGAGMKITNVADGVIAAGSKDVVNGGQIHDFVSGEIARPITFSADSGTPYDARMGTVVNVKGDNKNIHTTVSGNTLSVSLNESINVKSVTATESLSVANGASVDMGGNAIHNVGNATRPGDAVNYGQFQQAFGNLGNQINRVERRANAGAAAAIATAGLTQAYIPGKSMMSMSGGTFQGESSLAIGMSTISDNGSWVLKGSFSSTTRNQTGASVGVGFQF
ncbi:YadA-like family protein [Salmonella enterica]|nr:YadA-like family protein [Salmonella enterica]EIJ3423732.1 YadA-like family protein [Salmonella enterica]